MPTPNNPDHPRIAALRAEIAKLDAAITGLVGMPEAQAALQEQRAAKQRDLDALEAGDAPASPQPALQVDQSGQAGGASGGAGNTFGSHAHIGAKAEQHIGSLEAGRDTFVATQQTINVYYGDKPPENASALLSDYLEHFAAECDHLRLQRISGQRQKGSEQAAVPELRLQAVYTSLTTDGPPVTRLCARTTTGRARRFLERLEKVGRSPDHVRPERVITVAFEPQAERGAPGLTGERLTRTVIEHSGLSSVADETPLTLELQRPELAVEAIARQARLVLLGEPGSGKSTVLRYLGHLLARRACGAQLRLPGWADDDTPVPILIPLAQVAEQLGKAPDPDQALWQTLGSILDGPQGLGAGLRDSLRDALRRGGVILLCDGLDELSAEGGDQSPRTLVSQALQHLVARTRARMVITSRVLPYHQSSGSWQLPEDEGWRLRKLTPLAFGQVRTFVHAWFHSLALAYLDPDLTIEAAQQTAAALIAQLEARPALAPLVRSPLLLTMLVLLHDNGRVPENEVALYEQCVVLLLERWEPERQPRFKRPGLIERLGSPPGLDLNLPRNPLHELAFEAHREASLKHESGISGSGMIYRKVLYGSFTLFFTDLQLPDSSRACQTLEQVLTQEAGLLVARGDGIFAFPHLSFQEYLAACYLADHGQMQDLAYSVWQSDDRERWHKVLVLLAGRLVAQGKAPRDGLLWLKMLWNVCQDETPKPDQQWFQDVRLAALTYHAMSGRAAFAGNRAIDRNAEIEHPLRTALCALFVAREAAVPPADRLIAGRVLGELGDPRYPVSDAKWRESLTQPSCTLTADGAHYWRYVPAGRYRISGWKDDQPSAEHDLPAFWIARLPIAVAQFTRFVDEGYRDDAHWTPNGLKWRGERTAPYNWGDAAFSEPNQPVVRVTWYEATAFCRWLTTQLAAALPADHVIRLPSEAEWEAAAAFAGPAQRRRYPWGDQPEPEPEQAVYDAWQLNAPAPVGLCPAGMAACGALDLVGNVWEWTSSSYRAYPDGAHTWVEDFKHSKDFTIEEMDVPVRGCAYYMDSTRVRCGARGGGRPNYWNNDQGLRVVVSPPARTNVLISES